MKNNPNFHSFSSNEKLDVQRLLLNWYSNHKRSLPWRIRRKNTTEQNYAYRVLVSEVMLQQTQVCTVIDYFERWIERWPTLISLSTASLEDVQREWKGLGYYSRGRRLLELARSLPNGKELPKSSRDLLRLPGVGRYTAGAVASIAFNECVPAVDGNVIRVLCRLRAVGGTVDSKLLYTIWDLAGSLVPDKRPGDWNQALMELGATVCTPRNPKCSECPIKEYCHAVNTICHEVEDCFLCLPCSSNSAKVTDFPRKKEKKPARTEHEAVCIVISGIGSSSRYFVIKKESSGLLADLWQFPSFSTKISTANVVRHIPNLLKLHCNLAKNSKPTLRYLGSVQHKFSHINMTYSVVTVKIPVIQDLSMPSCFCDSTWVTRSEFESLPVSTAMHKVFSHFLHSSKKS